MNFDDDRQLSFDFESILKGASKGRARTHVKASDAVPKEWLKVLFDVKTKVGIKLSEISDKTGYTTTFCSHALRAGQRVSFEEYSKLKDAIADIVFGRILDA